jgi:WD40 repeat protein
MDTLKVIKILNSKDTPIKEIYGEGVDAIGKLTQVKYINYNQKLQGVITSTDKGNIQVLNNYNNFAFDEKFEFTAHYGPVTQMAVSPDNQQLFTAGQDGTLMIWNIGEYLL